MTIVSSKFRVVVAVVASCGLAVAACGSDDAPSASPSADAAVEAPSLVDGGVADGTVDVDGVEIEYATAVPVGFEPGDTAPMLLALPSGGQDIRLARGMVENIYAPEAIRLGWVVVSPAAPGGVLFFDGSESLLPDFVDWIETWVDIEGGVPHVAGASNGGLSVFRYAAENPERVRSIVTFPGFAGSDADRAALSELTDVPIRMYVGRRRHGVGGLGGAHGVRDRGARR